MMTTKNIEICVNEAREFGECYLGEMSFDVIKDTKKINNYIKKNNIENIYLVHFEENDNVKDQFGAPAMGWYLISQ